MTRPATETTTRLGLRSIAIGWAGPGTLIGFAAGWTVCSTRSPHYLKIRVYGQPADFPPSTKSTWPVVKDALLEARKTIALAISSDSPIRWSGTLEMRPAF